MNTIRSTWYGWGVLIVAGAGSYYYAKKSVNADRAERQEKELRRRRLIHDMEERERISRVAPKSAAHSKQQMDHAASPSGEASLDPAPTRHTPSGDGGVAGGKLPTPPEKSKYEPSEPYRSKRGDRFS